MVTSAACAEAVRATISEATKPATVRMCLFKIRLPCTSVVFSADGTPCSPRHCAAVAARRHRSDRPRAIGGSTLPRLLSTGQRTPLALSQAPRRRRPRTRTVPILGSLIVLPPSCCPYSISYMGVFLHFLFCVNCISPHPFGKPRHPPKRDVAMAEGNCHLLEVSQPTCRGSGNCSRRPSASVSMA